MATIESATEIRAFRVEVPEEELADLRRRIAATRWPERETVADESQGVQLATMQELVRYWGTEYDFRRFEARLNAFPQFITSSTSTKSTGATTSRPGRSRTSSRRRCVPHSGHCVDGAPTNNGGRHD